MLYEFLRQKLKMYNVKVSKSAKNNSLKKSFKIFFYGKILQKIDDFSTKIGFSKEEIGPLKN